MNTSNYLNQLLRSGQFWFLKESAMDLWLSNKNPEALAYLAIACHCMDEDSMGQHWLQECRLNLSKDLQKELTSTIPNHAPANIEPKVRLMLSELAA